jgi:hypothetical protein
MAFVAAATLRRTQGAMDAFAVILATNYDQSMVTRVEKEYNDVLLAISSSAATGPGTWPRDRIEQAASKNEDELGTKLRLILQQLDGRPLPPWPFDGYRFYPPTTAYTLKAIAMNATSADLAARQPLVKSSRPPSAFAWSAAAGFERTLFLDTDTIVVRDVLPALDALAAWDMALVHEYSTFSIGAAYLYTKLLEVDDYYNIHANAKKRKVKAAWKNFAAYEEQFNTGVMAYRSSDPCVLSLMQRWEHEHHSRQQCREDHVAWDQCSLPWALRVSNVRVGTLPEAFNAREALGRGCSWGVYDRMGVRANLTRAAVVHDFTKAAFHEAIASFLFPNRSLHDRFVEP